MYGLGNFHDTRLAICGFTRLNGLLLPGGGKGIYWIRWKMRTYLSSLYSQVHAQIVKLVDFMDTSQAWLSKRSLGGRTVILVMIYADGTSNCLCPGHGTASLGEGCRAAADSVQLAYPP